MHVRTFAKGAALGAAAAYLFDPVSGDGRRAQLRDQANAALRRYRERADDLSQHASSVVQGKVQELSRPMRDRPTDDPTAAGSSSSSESSTDRSTRSGGTTS